LRGANHRDTAHRRHAPQTRRHPDAALQRVPRQELRRGVVRQVDRERRRPRRAHPLLRQ
jgi:hypothetical protein